MKYRIAFYHNGAFNKGNLKYGGAVAVKDFKTAADALKWAEITPKITPIKLLIWDNDIDCFNTLKEF